MTKNYTCIVCPMGCNIDAEIENGIVTSVKGNTCKRGEEYVRSEITNPVRTVTSTVKTVDGRVVSVKTSRPIPKNMIFECMKEINSLKIDLNFKPGDVIIENIAGCEADLILTSALL